MNYHTNVELVKLKGNLNQVSDELIEGQFEEARYDVEKLIGKDTYHESIESGDEEETADRFKKIQLAETYFVIKHLVPVINVETDGAGITKATGFNENRKENLSENDIDRIQERWHKKAIDLLAEFMKCDDADEDEECDHPFIGENVQMVSI